MAFDGTHIHLVRHADDNVRMILPPTSDGQAPIVYTYTVSGLGNPEAWRLMGHTSTLQIYRRQCSDDSTAIFGRSSLYRLYLYG